MACTQPALKGNNAAAYIVSQHKVPGIASTWSCTVTMQRHCAGGCVDTSELLEGLHVACME